MKWLVILAIVVAAVIFWNQKKQDSLNAAMLTQGFEASTLFRFASREYFDSTGELPSSNAQLGMGAPEDYSNLALRSASIIEGGVIELVYNVNTGVDGGIIRYVPTIVPEMIKWSCETPDYVDIADYFLCRYIPNVEEPAIN